MDPPFPHHVPYFCIILTQTYAYIFILLNLEASDLSLAYVKLGKIKPTKLKTIKLINLIYLSKI